MLTTGDFLKQLFATADSGFVELFYLLPPEAKRPHGMPRSLTRYAPLPLNRPIPDPIPDVAKHNGLGYGVYFGTTASTRKIEPVQRTTETGYPYLTYPRRKASDVDTLHFLWCDIDDISVEAAIERLTSFVSGHVIPTLIVRSGGGVHAYWTLQTPIHLDDDSRVEVKKLLTAIARRYQGDTKCADLARVMRLPGTVNTKPGRDGARCEVIKNYVDAVPYHLMRSAYRAYMPREVAAPKRTLTPTKSDELPRQARRYLDNPPGRGERNKALYVAARACNDAGLSEDAARSILTSTAAFSGLEQHEIDTTIASAYRAARGVIATPIHTRMAFNDRRGL